MVALLVTLPITGRFALNGLVMADRTLTAKYYEVQRVYQPVDLELVSHDDHVVRLKVINRRHFSNLSDLTVLWQLSTPSGIALEGRGPRLSTSAGVSELFELELPQVSNGEDAWLNVAFQLDEPNAWAESGHVVASGQWHLPRADTPLQPEANKSLPPMTITEEGNRIILQSDQVKVTFDRHSGTLIQLELDGKELLADDNVSGPRMQLFGAPTDNDRGFGNWLAKAWSEAGLDQIELVPVGCNVQRVSPSVAKILVAVEGKLKKGSMTHNAEWLVQSDGVLRLTNRFQSQGDLPPLPRVGVVLRLDDKFKQLTWFGRGWHENYPDRKLSADVGRWSCSVADTACLSTSPRDRVASGCQVASPGGRQWPRAVGRGLTHPYRSQAAAVHDQRFGVRQAVE